MVFSFSRDFVKAFIQFKKPIVVAINGPALGLGASILPLCDIVWASEKAWFQTPYATIRLTPAGCSSYTFPQILGVALVSLLFSSTTSQSEMQVSESQQDPFPGVRTWQCPVSETKVSIRPSDSALASSDVPELL